MFEPRTRWLLIPVVLMLVATVAWATTKAKEDVKEKDLIDTAIEVGSFDTLVKAIQEAGLTKTLKGNGPFTVFAPNDDAFDKLPEGELEKLLKDKERLQALLKYHVVPGKLTAAELLAMESIETLHGDPVTITLDGEVVEVDEAHVIASDINCTNGMLHVIDEVLVVE